MPPGIGYPPPPEMIPGQELGFGIEPLAPPDMLGLPAPQPEPQLPPWTVLPEQAPEPVQPAAPQPPPFDAVKAKTSYSGYGQPQERVPTNKVTAPLYRQRQEVDAASQAAEQAAQNYEQMGQLQTAYDENVTAPMLQEKSDIIESYEQVRQNLQREFEGERNQREASIQQAIDAIPQSDPKRWWKNMSGFQKGAAYISAAIDGYLNPRGENGAVNLAMQLADQDARAQAEDIATARAKVGYEQTAYERMLGNQQLKTQDYLAAKEMRLESLAVATEIKGMSFKSPITQMKYKMQADEFRAKSAETRVERLNQLAVAESNHIDAAAERAFKSSYQKREHEFQVKKAKAEADAKKGSNILLDPAQSGRQWAITANTADREGRVKNWADKDLGISTYTAMLVGADGKGGLKNYLIKANELGRTYSGPGANTAAVVNRRQQLRAELEAEREQLIADYRHGLYGAALVGKEGTNFDKMVPPPDSITGPAGTKALQTFIQNKSVEAQTKFINPLGIVDAETDKPVNLVEEWGTIAPAEENTPFLDAPALVESGQAVAKGLQELPRQDPQYRAPGALEYPGQAPAEPPPPWVTKASRQQAQLLEIRAAELVNRAKNYASRSGMTPEQAAQTLNTLKEWTAITGDIAPDVSDRIMQQAIEFEKQISKPVGKDPDLQYAQDAMLE